MAETRIHRFYIGTKEQADATVAALKAQSIWSQATPARQANVKGYAVAAIVYAEDDVAKADQVAVDCGMAVNT